MGLLIFGLVLFLGIHSTRIFAEGLRSALINRFGEGPWKGFYTFISIVGLVIIVLGYRRGIDTASVVWVPPFAFLHLTALLMIPAFIFLVAAYAPAGRIKAKLRHPMLIGVKTWALAHLLSNGMSHEILLFGAFLVWAVLDYIACRRRDRSMGLQYLAGPVRNDIFVIVAGLAVWAAFAFFAHEWLFGIAPFI